MGTNYYVVKNGASTHGGWHIGKSSCGWMFAFQTQNDVWADPPVVWNTYNQVKDWLKKYTVDQTNYAIVDEYDRVVSYDDFIGLVEQKQNDPVCSSNPDNFHYSRNVDGYRFNDEYFS